MGYHAINREIMTIERINRVNTKAFFTSPSFLYLYCNIYEV